MDADGGNVRRLTRGDADVDPAWSPDGTEIAYGHCFNIDSPSLCTLDLFVMDVATGASRQLTRTPFVYEAGYAWSPDSAQIAFTRFIPLFDVKPKESTRSPTWQPDPDADDAR